LIPEERLDIRMSPRSTLSRVTSKKDLKALLLQELTITNVKEHNLFSKVWKKREITSSGSSRGKKKKKAGKTAASAKSHEFEGKREMQTMSKKGIQRPAYAQGLSPHMRFARRGEGLFTIGR